MAQNRGENLEPNFSKIRQECLSKGILFEDPEFPAEKSNLFYHQPPDGVEFDWRRPKELTANPHFVIDNPKKFDLIPGRYGQRWLVSALSVLCQYRALFYRAVPADQGFTPGYQYTGVFHFRFWFCGEWTEVLVDDRLPVLNGQLAFVQAQSSDQYWAALLEKAYAKLVLHGSYYRLHGSYEALAYTSSADVFTELTGGATEQLHFEPSMPLSNLISQTLKLTVILTAVVVTLSENSHVQLIKLRLPPNVLPYNGPWSNPDNVEWKRVSPKVRARLNIDKEAAQGAFWMSIREFEQTFSKLEMVHLDKETCNAEDRFLRLNARAQQMRSFQGAWKRGATAGGCRNNPDSFHINPQLLLRVDETGDVIICLLQQIHQEPRVIGFSIYKFDGENQEKTLPSSFFKTAKALDHSTYSNSKQVVKRVLLDGGSYVIVPTTYDVAQEAVFTVRVYSEKPIHLWHLDSPPHLAKQPVIKASQYLKEYEKMFLAFSDEKKTVNSYELQELLHSCLPNDYMKSSSNLEVCRRAIQAFQINHQSLGRLGYSQFQDFICSLKVWAKIFEHYTPTTSGVMKAESLRDALFDVGFELSSENFQFLMLRYMRRDGTLRFGDFVACILHLITIFNVSSRTRQAGLTTSEISYFLQLTSCLKLIQCQIIQNKLYPQHCQRLFQIGSVISPSVVQSLIIHIIRHQNSWLF